MATTERVRPPAHLHLPGSGTAPASVEVIFQPRPARIARAVGILVVSILLMPVVFFIPPHFLWPLLSLAAGVYFARKYWVGEYYVTEFEGSCPRCGGALEVKPGSRIRNPQALECYGCHRQPELVIDEPGS